jgi:release factor glutamine methyltransferase
MTAGEAYIDFKKELGKVYDAREAATISDWVFESLTSMKRWERMTHQNKEININEYQQLQKYLKELLQHKPAQYVLNEAWFYKIKFFVNEDVLIPRPETEELVEWIVNEVKAQNIRSSKLTNILDIGSGSGCISIALKKELPDANIVALDISGKALEVAKKNARELNAAVGFLEIDFLDETKWGIVSEYDVIVSNPPYIPVKEKESLEKNVIDFEPEVALFVEDDNPFIFYKKIARFSKMHLKKAGKIYVEINETKAEEVKEVFEKAGFNVTIKKDIYGKERMVKAVKQTI